VKRAGGLLEKKKLEKLVWTGHASVTPGESLLNGPRETYLSEEPPAALRQLYPLGRRRGTTGTGSGW